MAGQIRSDDLVLEPSAGTGILAQFAKLKGASLMLNELAEDRSKILRRLFSGVPLFSVNAEQINDYLAGKTQPSVALIAWDFGRLATSRLHLVKILWNPSRLAVLRRWKLLPEI
jgi:phospholipid N-methyltransferase